MIGTLAFLASACAPALVASPYLVAVWPAPGASLPVSRFTFELTFNRGLRSDATWATVWRADDDTPAETDTQVDPENPRRMSVRLLRAQAGAYRLRWHAVSVRGAAVSDGEQPFSMLAELPAREPPRLETNRSEADSGELLEMSGAGFAPDCPVHLAIGDDEQSLSTAQTDARGSFAASGRVPASVPFGLQPVVAIDACGGSAAAPLLVRWGGWPPLSVFATGQPGPSSGEVTIAVSLRNRSDYVLEHIHVVVRDPEYARFVATEEGARHEGQLVVWDVPTIDRGVLGPIHITYRVSRPITAQAWVEFRHRRPRGCGGEECLPAFISEATFESAPVAPADTRGLASCAAVAMCPEGMAARAMSTPPRGHR